MALLSFLGFSAILFFIAYLVIGRALSRMFHLTDETVTPAHAMRDGLDFEPASAGTLLPQHFSAIAAAGPVVGPIVAGIYFGWGPAWIWILLGSIFIGGIHDFTSIVASIRHRGRTVAEIVRQYMNPRAYILFLLFVWSALVYVIIAFADVTASTFVAPASSAGGDAPGPAVATSSMLYLGLAVVMGLCQRFLKLNPILAKVIFLPLVFVAIWVGPLLPLDLGHIFPALGGPHGVQQLWGYILLAYCLVAAMAPMWSLLQPRGELGGYFLYIVMLLGFGGVVAGAITGDLTIHQAFFKTWSAPDQSGAFGGVTPLFPILFITVACGACSGFHSIVASGTTSKQLNRETDATPVAYGGMLLEGLFACLSLATLMVLAPDVIKGKTPNWIYASGLSDLGNRLFAPLFHSSAAMHDVLFQFALLCFATFVFDTLDACTRLARYVLMELLGWEGRWASLFATVISLALPVITVTLPPIMLDGKPQPLWLIFWNIFGSSNQLLAALTLLGVTVWMARKNMNYWIALAPTIFMMIMTLWSLVLMMIPYIHRLETGQSIEIIRHVQFIITLSLLALSIWLVVEAFITWRQINPPAESSDLPAGTAEEAAM